MCLAIPGKVISITGSPTDLSSDEMSVFDELWGDVLFSDGTSGGTSDGDSDGTFDSSSYIKQGVRRQVNLSYVPEVAIGDYVIVHAGFAISQLDQEEAEATLALFLSGDD